MSEYSRDEVAPQLFECFIGRGTAGLPEDFLSAAKGVVVAGPDLIRGLDDFSGSTIGYRVMTAPYFTAICPT
jgi:hypothetical protein